MTHSVNPIASLSEINGLASSYLDSGTLTAKTKLSCVAVPGTFRPSLSGSSRVGPFDVRP
jgi:hypothetical protein